MTLALEAAQIIAGTEGRGLRADIAAIAARGPLVRAAMLRVVEAELIEECGFSEDLAAEMTKQLALLVDEHTTFKSALGTRQ